MKEEIKEALKDVTNGADWTNFDDNNYSNIVYEYDRLTELTCDIIAQCKTEEHAHLISKSPEWLRWQNERIELLEKELEQTSKYGLILESMLLAASGPSAVEIARNNSGKE